MSSRVCLTEKKLHRFKWAFVEEGAEADLNTTKMADYGYDFATWKSTAVLSVGPEGRDWSDHFPHHPQRGAAEAAGSPSWGKQNSKKIYWWCRSLVDVVPS